MYGYQPYGMPPPMGQPVVYIPVPAEHAKSNNDLAKYLKKQIKEMKGGDKKKESKKDENYNPKISFWTGMLILFAFAPMVGPFEKLLWTALWRMAGQ